MKTKIMDHLLVRLADIFGKPRNLDKIAEELAGVADPSLTETDLGELAANIIAQRKAKGFPSPSELMTLIKAVPEMKGRGGGSSNPHRTGLFDPLTKTGPNKGPHEKRSKEKGERIGGNTRYFGYGSHAALERETAFVEAEKNACRFLRGRTITTEAIAARWAVGLLDFAIREGREPDAAEEQRIIAKVRANDVDARDFVDVPCPVPVRGGMMRQAGDGHRRRFTQDAGRDTRQGRKVAQRRSQARRGAFHGGSRMTDRAAEIAHGISARYYTFDTARPFSREDMDAEIAAALRAYAAERLIEIIEEDDAARREDRDEQAGDR